MCEKLILVENKTFIHAADNVVLDQKSDVDDISLPEE